jgi:hypothetical protein
MTAIAALADGATATIDYSKSDVFAAGMIAYHLRNIRVWRPKSRVG